MAIKAYNAKQWEIPLLMDGRKTVTRRIIKTQPHEAMPENHDYCRMPLFTANGMRTLHYMDVIEQNPFRQTRYFESFAPYDKQDTLYVQETFFYETHMEDLTAGEPDLPSGRYSHRYIYKADSPDYPVNIGVGAGGWSPSIHMPKEAARIWLKVTDVRVERLKDITEEQAKQEGFSSRKEFIETFLKLYPDCTEESWLWVIEFNRCDKPEQ